MVNRKKFSQIHRTRFLRFPRGIGNTDNDLNFEILLPITLLNHGTAVHLICLVIMFHRLSAICHCLRLEK